MAHDMSKGMHWIGHPGSLNPIIDYGEESSQLEIALSVEAGMGGGQRVRVSRERAPRTWSLSIPNAHADDIEHVESLLTALLPPYQLVTAKAQVSNVLTPERSTLQDLDYGTLALAGGWPIADAGGRYTTTTALNPTAAFGNQALVRVGPCPIPPQRANRPVTASALLATGWGAGARVVLDWLDSSGVQIGTGVNGNAVTGVDALRRSTVTAMPVWGAVACRIGIVYAEVISQPQVTWTSAQIPEWSIGKGADRVVPTAFSESTSLAVPDSYALRRGDYSLSLMEVRS